MSVDTKHPLFLEFAPDWKQCRDTYRGDRIVKEAGFDYLPATSGMIADGIDTITSPGYKAYVAYRRRARVPGAYREAVEAMLGVMHNKPPLIELPPKMEGMREFATLRGESLEMLLRRVNEEQLLTGRVGLLLEVPEAPPVDGAPVLPLIALYETEDVINWDEGDSGQTMPESLNLVVIDETEDERNEDFGWERVEKHRVLVLGNADDNEQRGEGTYRVAVLREDTSVTEADFIEPSIAGVTLNEIPFVFINTKDVAATPDDPPLLELSNLVLTIYRGEADYRQALFMQGQDTWVEIGNSSTPDGTQTRLGAGAIVRLPMGGSAKFEGVNSEGLSEMRSALENDTAAANQKAGALLEAISSSAESGEALRIRVASRTASLNQIALAAAFSLQRLLRIAAVWVGADPEKVIVSPNVDFVDDIMAGQELTQLMAAKQLGAPLSLASVHGTMRNRGLTEMTFEGELEQLEREAAEGVPGATPTDEVDESDTAEGDEGEEEEADLEPEEEDDEDDVEA